MSSKDNLISRIKNNYSTFSKGQKKLASYILEHYDKAVFMTASKLGKEAQVSESTTVRFAVSLGYDGYPEFQHALEELVRNKLNSIQRMKVTYGDVPQMEILDRVLHSDIDKIKRTMEVLDPGAFNEAVETIATARHVYIIGIRSSAALASFLGFYLNYLFDNVRILTVQNISDVFEQMVRITSDDVVIGISFPRYSMLTQKALEFANKRQAKVVTLTDSIHSPINLYSSCNLIAKSDMASIVDSLVAPLSVINALIVALCMKCQDKVVQTLETLESIWDEYQVYSNDELNPPSSEMSVMGDQEE